MQLKNGDIFAEHYQLKKLLGVGSFGEVWLARNILADVDVAIKLYGLLDDNGIKDFREEFKLAYKLHHPNLLHLNHFDVFGQCPFLVMPYCPKGSSYNPQIEMFARFKMKSSFHKTKRII